MEPVEESIIKSYLTTMIRRGNHKSATTKEYEKVLISNFEKESQHGYMIPTTIESVENLKEAGVILIGIALQYTIDEYGKKKTTKKTARGII